MENEFPPFYVYAYPRYFIFDDTILPSDFEEGGDYEWDDETGYLLTGDGERYYHVSSREDSFGDSPYLIPWIYEVEPLGGNSDLYQYALYPNAISSKSLEIIAVVKYLLRVDKESANRQGKGITVESILEYQLDRQFSAIQFLDYLKTGVKEYNFHSFSIAWLRLKKKILTWHNEKVNELKNLLGFLTESTQPAAAEEVEETELTPLEITAVAHKVVLFHELGIIEPLKKLCKNKNPTLSDKKFAKLVGGIMGFQGTQIETIRKALSGYGQGGESDVRSRAALDKVKSELMKFGIEL